MMKFKNVIVIAAAVVFATAASAVPSYIDKCRRSDENLHDCILKSAKKAVPEIMKGDAALQIPDLNTFDPQDQTLTVDEVIYTLKNIKHNAGVLTPTHARMDFAGHSAEIGMHLPFLVWKADFAASGKHKGKDIQATGRATIKYDGIQFNYTKHCEDKEIEGKIYLQIVSDSTVGTIEKISIVHNYDDTAVGKDELDSMVPDIKAALHKKLETICSQLVTYAMNAVLKSIPKNEIFLP